jgi:MinD superfamily P-loop ATPase
MKIAVASGKGGTGKTTISTSLALCASSLHHQVTFADCDVEAPNSHFFLKPLFSEEAEITLDVPKIDEERCTYCGACRDICRFNAITVFGKTIMTFQDMCHSCGGCFRVCPENAIMKTVRIVGKVRKGAAGEDRKINFVSGMLRVGEAMAVPLIKAVKKEAESMNGLLLLDSPPGTSCPMVETVHDADFVILVTEPTPFGLYDLKIAVEVMHKINKKFGIIINKSGLGDNDVERWCKESDIQILMQIPFDKKMAKAYSRGTPVIARDDALRHDLSAMLQQIIESCEGDR